MNRRIVITNKVEELEKMASFVGELAAEAGISPELEMSLHLALEEVVSNVILYAYPEREVGRIWIAATSDEKTLTFTITDKGKAFDPTKVKEADITLSAEERQIGGLGIFIVKNIMDEVAYQRLGGFNVLTLRKNISESK